MEGRGGKSDAWGTERCFTVDQNQNQLSVIVKHTEAKGSVSGNVCLLQPS